MMATDPILQKRTAVLSRTGKCILGHKYKTHKQIAHKTLNFNHLHQLRLGKSIVYALFLFIQYTSFYVLESSLYSTIFALSK